MSQIAVARVITVLVTELTTEQCASVILTLRALDGSDADRKFYASTIHAIQMYEADRVEAAA